MRKQTISFPERHVLCVFPEKPEDLAEAISGMGLNDSYPVIVLIGGNIEEKYVVVSEQAIQTIAKIADEIKGLVICGGTDIGVMAEIGQIRSAHQYQFPLVGITLEKLVTWPGGPRSTDLLWWGTKRWQLEPHYSHFILVPGSEFGDESAWIVDAATIISKGRRSVTILINGGKVSEKDINLSVASGRAVIALGGTGRLANDLALEHDISALIRVIPANDEEHMEATIRKALSDVPITTAK